MRTKQNSNQHELSPAYKLHRLVSALDTAADRVLRSKLHISYRRALFLIVLDTQGPLLQHNLAVYLGYSDAAISLMLAELSKNRLVQIRVHPMHKKRRIAEVTVEGGKLAKKAQNILDTHFAIIAQLAGVDLPQYADQTDKLFESLIGITQQKESQVENY